MAPILIDHRGLVKIGFIALASALCLFVSGFLSGYQRAAVIYQPGSELASLALPELVDSAAADMEPRRPNVMAAGEDIDVDQPEPQDNVINDNVVNISNSIISKRTLNPEPGKQPSKIQAGVTIDKTQDANMHSASLDGNIENVGSNNLSEEYGISKNDHEQNKTNENKRAASAPLISFNSEELKKIKYTVQVGIYGRLMNAENMVNMLQAQQFNAYLSEYLNAQNEVLYNVRFGYFFDKTTASSALQKYKNNHKGDGYLVKFSLKNITGIADADSIKPSDIIEKNDNNSTPGTISSDISKEKIPQLEVSEAMSFLTNTQTSVITN